MPDVQKEILKSHKTEQKKQLAYSQEFHHNETLCTYSINNKKQVQTKSQNLRLNVNKSYQADLPTLILYQSNSESMISYQAPI